MTCSVISRRSATSSSIWCPSGTVNTLMMVAPPCLPAFSASAILRLLSFEPGFRVTTARSSGLGLHHLTVIIVPAAGGMRKAASSGKAKPPAKKDPTQVFASRKLWPAQVSAESLVGCADHPCRYLLMQVVPDTPAFPRFRSAPYVRRQAAGSSCLGCDVRRLPYCKVPAMRHPGMRLAL